MDKRMKPLDPALEPRRMGSTWGMERGRKKNETGIRRDLCNTVTRVRRTSLKKKKWKKNQPFHCNIIRIPQVHRLMTRDWGSNISTRKGRSAIWKGSAIGYTRPLHANVSPEARPRLLPRPRPRPSPRPPPLLPSKLLTRSPPLPNSHPHPPLTLYQERTRTPK